MDEEPQQEARDAYLRMRAAKEIELRTFRNALAEWPDNRQSDIRQGIAELVAVLENDIAVLDKLIAAWDADARQEPGR
ncbi:hypothetical protein [Sphingomonas sp. S-NIH.Pt15_0812]|uniref:hypothetical protein n=1 Tax=Sphingomonas sp. S-NIH.Pt15_0812 TaxID=1920129 RepID=UPI000F7DA4DC|nr:hypothetical protein [Sphingomonas sp. S-NIH.Pt15_0812]RSU45760.1 hypothetical protein BRX43_17765 [Sphingomonas sp. S-NIH.Pt15_0812]